MAGHSKFKNIMFRKGAQDKKRAKRFAKFSREISVAVKLGGSDTSSNPRLRTAILAARNENMPNDNINRTIAKADGEENSTNYEEIRYEGYGVNGVAVIIEALTDNRNRTSSQLRAIFSKFNGSMSEQGAVVFMFKRLGEIQFLNTNTTEDKVFEAAIEYGAENITSDETTHSVFCKPDMLHNLTNKMQAQCGEIANARLIWQPQTTTSLNEKDAETLIKMLEALEDNDDVQQVYANFDISDEALANLSELSQE